MSKAIDTGRELAAGQSSAKAQPLLAHPLTGALTPRMAPGALAALYHAFMEARGKREDQA